MLFYFLCSKSRLLNQPGWTGLYDFLPTVYLSSHPCLFSETQENLTTLFHYINALYSENKRENCRKIFPYNSLKKNINPNFTTCLSTFPQCKTNVSFHLHFPLTTKLNTSTVQKHFSLKKNFYRLVSMIGSIHSL